MRFLLPFVVSASLCVVPGFSWLQQRPLLAHQQQHQNSIAAVHHHHQRQYYSSTTIFHSSKSSSLASSSSSDDNDEILDYTGKVIYQRTFYRLSGGPVPKPNALVLEERLRFKSDPDREGYILPYGKRTFILRKGTAEDEITDELYRVDLGPNDGPGTMDTTIATVLYMAANPNIVQGDVLQLSCESGVAGILGCIAAKFSNVPTPVLSKDRDSSANADDEEEILTVPHHEKVFPTRMRQLTLSEEGGDNLLLAGDIIRDFSHTDKKITLADVPWSIRVPNRRYQYYRTIIGSDIDISYPSAKELARVVANSLLPSNPTLASDLESSSSSSSSSSGGSSSFGGLGMDLADTATTGSSSSTTSPETESDPKYSPTFIHVCPDARENTMYLRQFLEKGFKMTTNSNYFNLQRLQFVFQTLPESDINNEDTILENLDLEVKSDTSRSYQCLEAIHNPEYVAEGSGEYFFPLESGEYEGGSRSTYLEPEADGSPW